MPNISTNSKFVFEEMAENLRQAMEGAPLAPTWLAIRSIMFGLIFFATIMIDVFFKPVGPLLMKLINDGSSDETENRCLKP